MDQRRLMHRRRVMEQRIICVMCTKTQSRWRLPRRASCTTLLVLFDLRQAKRPRPRSTKRS